MSNGIRTETIFDLRDGPNDISDSVYDEVFDLWGCYELGNDDYYFKWDAAEHGDTWPEIAAYLNSLDIKTCLIHWWW
jgi:hypothetical protein